MTISKNRPRDINFFSDYDAPVLPDQVEDEEEEETKKFQKIG